MKGKKLLDTLRINLVSWPCLVGHYPSLPQILAFPFPERSEWCGSSACIWMSFSAQMQPDAEGQEGCWQTHGEMLPTTKCSGYAILNASLYINILMGFLIDLNKCKIIYKLNVRNPGIQWTPRYLPHMVKRWQVENDNMSWFPSFVLLFWQNP